MCVERCHRRGWFNYATCGNNMKSVRSPPEKVPTKAKSAEGFLEIAANRGPSCQVPSVCELRRGDVLLNVQAEKQFGFHRINSWGTR